MCDGEQGCELGWTGNSQIRSEVEAKKGDA
jgi:hypothetical protein